MEASAGSSVVCYNNSHWESTEYQVRWVPFQASLSRYSPKQGKGGFCMHWAVASAAFLASAVEFVEALTIVLVVGVTMNWRSSLAGAFAAAATLAVIIATFGVAIVQWVPLDLLRSIVGIILILFGLKWLKKAILRYSGMKALYDQ